MRFDLKAGLTRLANDIVAKPGDKKTASSSSASAPASMSKSAPAAPKKAAKKGDDALHCPSCGSAGPWTILYMTLKVHNVPATKLSKDGDDHAYDDTKGESEGWDYIVDGLVKCNKCENEADVNDLMEQAGGTAQEEPVAPAAPATEPGLE
jgi:DNA-directed RNA polymerase subunit M/transcription elongation factor TFIIS